MSDRQQPRHNGGVRWTIPVFLYSIATVALIVAFNVAIQPASSANCIPRKDYEPAKQWVRANHSCIMHLTPRSSWIAWGEYCHAGGKGYFVLKVRTGKRKGYLYEGIPQRVWSGFKQAPSAGRYYNRRIRKRYGFRLCKQFPAGQMPCGCKR